MQVASLVEHDWLRRPLGESPERIAVLSHGIKWVDVQQLSDVVVEHLFEAHTSVLNAVSEVTWSLSEQLQAFLQTDDILLANQTDTSTLVKYLDGTRGHLCVHLAEFVSGPLDTVKCLFWEHF